MPLPLIPPADGMSHLTWPDGTHDVAFRWQPTVKRDLAMDTTLFHFDGRAWPVAYFKEYGDETFDVSFFVNTATDGDQWANLRAIVDGTSSRTVLVWTDVFGNQFNCIVTADPVTQEYILGAVPGSVSGRPLGGQYQKISFKVHRVE